MKRNFLEENAIKFTHCSLFALTCKIVFITIGFTACNRVPDLKILSDPDPVFTIWSDPDPVFTIWSDPEPVFKIWSVPMRT